MEVLKTLIDGVVINPNRLTVLFADYIFKSRLLAKVNWFVL